MVAEANRLGIDAGALVELDQAFGHAQGGVTV